MMETNEDYDEIDWLIDNDPIELGRRYRKTLKDLKNVQDKIAKIKAGIAVLKHELFD